MQWRKTILSDDTNVNVSSFAYGNGYYIVLNASQYVINIMYTQNLQDEWIVQTIKNSGADPITTAGIVFDGSNFVVPYTTTLTKALSALYFETPTDTVTDRVVVGGYTRPIALNSVQHLGGEVVVCGARQEALSNAATSAYIWHCADPAGDWYGYRILEYTPELSGNTLAAVYDTVSSEYQVYVVAKQDAATNIHRIYTSSDLATWSEPRTVATDTLASPPHPAFAYCENYDAIALFLHGRIYVSKAGQAFTALAYPAGIEAESIRTATSDGTKFLAPSASLNQASLKVLYSSGDPTVADNWRVQTLSVGTQVSPDAAFLPDINLFIVLAGANSNILKPAIYTAVYLASDFNMMRDRVPTYPGRVSLTPTEQQNVYTLVREDDPTEVGTKLSKVNLLSDDAALAVWNNTPPNVLCTPSTALEHLGNNAFHVGDILTTVRDLSTDDNWLKCTGGGISEVDYPELYPLLQTGSVEDDWNTNVIDDSTPYTSGSNCSVATDGEWYIMVAAKYNDSNSTYDYYAYYTRDPNSAWTKKTIRTGSNWSYIMNYIPLIYANGYFAFIVTEFISGIGYGNSFVVYADDPSGIWNTMQIGVSGRRYQGLKYLNGEYLTFANYNNNGAAYYTDVLTFDEIDGQVTTTTIMSNMDSPSTQTNDIDYYNGQWYAIWHQGYTSGSFYVTDTRLYHSDTLATVYSAGQYGTVESTSSSSDARNYFYPENITCGNGYYVLWGYRHLNTEGTGFLDIYYSNNLAHFTRSYMSQYVGGHREVSVPIFFDGAFYLATNDTAGAQNRRPYIIYGADPTNLTAKLLYNSSAYRTRLAASETTKTLFVGGQSIDYTTLTAAWQKVGKSLPKLSPGVGLNAYIKAKEGD